MSIFGYNQELHFRQIAEENQAAGWEKGKAEATVEYINSLMESLG